MAINEPLSDPDKDLDFKQLSDKELKELIFLFGIIKTGVRFSSLRHSTKVSLKVSQIFSNYSKEEIEDYLVNNKASG